MAYLKKIRRWLLSAELNGLLKIGIIDHYQPLPWLGVRDAKRSDSTLERWQSIDRELGELTGSSLDIGCNLGFFTFQMARRGFFSLGVEESAMLCHVCNLTKEVSGFENALFMRATVDESFCQRLPTVDVTLFLSVFHHIVRKSGMDAASRLMAELMQRTRKILFFETGQSNEANASWVKHLPFMEPDPYSWIEKYFLTLGASRVKQLGNFATHLSSVRRSLFAVYMD
jgi:hypothetical protein